MFSRHRSYADPPSTLKPPRPLFALNVLYHQTIPQYYISLKIVCIALLLLRLFHASHHSMFPYSTAWMDTSIEWPHFRFVRYGRPYCHFSTMPFSFLFPWNFWQKSRLGTRLCFFEVTSWPFIAARMNRWRRYILRRPAGTHTPGPRLFLYQKTSWYYGRLLPRARRHVTSAAKGLSCAAICMRESCAPSVSLRCALLFRYEG